MPDLTPITREEMFLDGNTELTPITREEMILAGADLDVITRREWFLKKYRSGGEIVLEDITITENGEVTAPSGKAYKKITTDVPLPENAYLLKNIPNTPCDVATFTDGANLPMPTLKVSIEPIQEGSGTPSPDNVRPISGWSGANVSVCGKNLIPTGTSTTKGYVDNSYLKADGTIGSDNTLFISEYFKVPSDVDCAWSSKNAVIYNLVSVCFYDENKNYISGTALAKATKIITIPSNATYCRSTQSKNENNKFQFEIGSTATTYEPYNGHTTTIPFTDSQGNPIEVYGGTVDVVNGTIKPNIEYDSYNGETLVGRWISDRDVYAEGTTPTIGAQVVDLGAYGSDISTQPTSIKSLVGVNNVYCDCGQIKEGQYFSESEEG